MTSAKFLPIYTAIGVAADHAWLFSVLEVPVRLGISLSAPALVSWDLRLDALEQILQPPLHFVAKPAPHRRRCIDEDSGLAERAADDRGQDDAVPDRVNR